MRQTLVCARLYEVKQQARQEAEANQQWSALLAEMRGRNRLALEHHDRSSGFRLFESENWDGPDSFQQCGEGCSYSYAAGVKAGY
jgi:hypothetical protein